MDELETLDRRQSIRVPVRGIAVLRGDDTAMHGMLENLSHGGALVDVPWLPDQNVLDVELRVGLLTSYVSARTVRIMSGARRWKIGVEFGHVDEAMRRTIDVSITAALRAARQRPVLVIDDRGERRCSLVNRLATRGMTPLAPRTPLEAIDLLTRTQLHVDVCLLAPHATEMHGVLADSFPWVTTAEITDDIDATVVRAIDAWAATDVARIATALG
jgi:hypothetical protein